MIENISPEELLILANTFALSLSEGRTADEINVLGNFIVAIGSLMLTFAAQKQLLSSQQEAQKAKTNETSSNNNSQQESDKAKTDESFSYYSSQQESDKAKTEESSSYYSSQQEARDADTFEFDSNNDL